MVQLKRAFFFTIGLCNLKQVSALDQASVWQGLKAKLSARINNCSFYRSVLKRTDWLRESYGSTNAIFVFNFSLALQQNATCYETDWVPMYMSLDALKYFLIKQQSYNLANIQVI